MSTDALIEQVLDEARKPAPKQLVTFYSRGRNLRLVRQPQLYQPNNFGQTVEIQRGVAYSFEPNGVLSIEPGKDVLASGPNGEEEDAVQWLRRHRLMNVYFHEDGREPGRPLPSEEEMLRRITEAEREVKPHRIAALLEFEQNSHGRQVVVQMAKMSLQRVAADLGGEIPPETPAERSEREELEERELEALEAERALYGAGGASLEAQERQRRAAIAASMAAADPDRGAE